MNCLIIEDEPLAALRLREYIQKVPFLQLSHTFDNGLDAIPVLQSDTIDLLFLDIEMDGLSGIQLLEALPHRPAVILTTAYDKYALKAFDLRVVDYLLKPYTFERFLQAISRVTNHPDARSDDTHRSFLFVKTDYRLRKVAFDDILFVEGMRDYRCLHLKNERIMTLETFGELAQRLSPRQFCRVHKSFLVAIDKIESIERDRITIDKALIPISATYRDEFYRQIGRSAPGSS